MEHTLGIIGFGSMAGGYHFENAKRDDVPFRVTAVLDVRESQRELARSRGVTVFDNLEDFLASHLFEMVLVATPNNHHCHYAVSALKAGYHVMVEKPAAMSSAELETMIATSKECGKLFTVHQNRRFDRDFLIVKKAIEDGLLGNVYNIESRICSAIRTDGQLGGMFGWRAFGDHGGGMLLDWGVHMLDQVLYLIDEPIVSVFATMNNLHGHEVDDWSRVIITFKSGLTAQVEVSTVSPVVLPRWCVTGDRGGLKIDAINSPTATIRHICDTKEAPMGCLVYPTGTFTHKAVEKQMTFACEVEDISYPPAGVVIPQDWASLYKNVGAALDGTEELIVKPEGVLRCFKVMEAAFKSAETHQTVTF